MFDPNARSITPTAAFKTSIKTLKHSYSHSNGYKSVQPWEWVQKSDLILKWHWKSSTFPDLSSVRAVILAWTDWSFTYFVCNNSRAALIKRDLRAVLSLICFRIPPGSIRGSFSHVNQCACTAGPLPWPDNSAQVPHLSRFDLDTSESIPPKESDRIALFMQPLMVICCFKSLQHLWLATGSWVIAPLPFYSAQKTILDSSAKHDGTYNGAFILSAIGRTQLQYFFTIWTRIGNHCNTSLWIWIKSYSLSCSCCLKSPLKMNDF